MGLEDAAVSRFTRSVVLSYYNMYYVRTRVQKSFRDAIRGVRDVIYWYCESRVIADETITI